jgi:hypothetical protein
MNIIIAGFYGGYLIIFFYPVNFPPGILSLVPNFNNRFAMGFLLPVINIKALCVTNNIQL